MKYRIALLFALCLTLLSSQSASAGKVVIKVEKNKATVTIGGEEFTTYNFAAEQMKPYFHPVYAPGKVLVVREKVFNKQGQQGNDAKTGLGHHHHKGIWVAIDTVNKEEFNYWGEADRMTASKVSASTCGDTATLHVVNDWLDKEQKPILKNYIDFTFTPERMMIVKMKLTAVDKPVTLGDTKEGLLAIRVYHTMRGLSGGRILNAQGDKGEKECWGKPTAWIDYHGEVNGKTVGVSLFDDPNNFRPSRYHVRDYALFSINPFGPKIYSRGKEKAAPVIITTEKPISLRYGLYVHAGDEKQGKVAEQYKAFLKATHE